MNLFKKRCTQCNKPVSNPVNSLCDDCSLKKALNRSTFDDIFDSPELADLANLASSLGSSTNLKLDDVNQLHETVENQMKKNMELAMKQMNEINELPQLSFAKQSANPAPSPNIANSVSNVPSKPPVSLEEAMEKLNRLVGLNEIKQEVNGFLKRLKGLQKLQNNPSIQVENPILHMAFLGPDGTGKRTVGEILSEVLFALGYIKENKFTLVDRTNLVGQHMGSTPHKVMETVQSALGGVLFIQNAHTLSSETGKDYGKEALDTLAKAMDTHRHDLVVIFSGYSSEMTTLLETNPGLSSNIAYRFSFYDYTPKQLAEIAEIMLSEKGYNCKEVLPAIEQAILSSSMNGSVLGNGRWIRQFIDKVIQQHLIRIAEEEVEDVSVITAEVVTKAVGHKSEADRAGLEKVRQLAIEQLNDMIGLAALKEEVKRMMNFFAIQKRKFDQGISSSKPTMHMVFAGPPGTGKTTVAKIMAQFLKGQGVLTNGHLIEVSRADLVGAHVGETALKVKKVINDAIGGVLFIDEAYALDGGSQDSYGQEAIDTLIKEMEEKRGNLIVILAGYDHDMERLLNKNAGFESRVANQFSFPNYSVEEIIQIAEMSLKKHRMKYDEETKSALISEIQKLADDHEGIVEGNGRWVRNFMDKLQIAQSDRIMNENSDDLETITKEDIHYAFELMF